MTINIDDSLMTQNKVFVKSLESKLYVTVDPMEGDTATRYKVRIVYWPEGDQTVKMPIMDKNDTGMKKD